MSAGEPYGLRPAGLVALDTLRIEAGLPLYGKELTEETTPYEAGLSRIVKLDKDSFVGQAALRRQRTEGFSRTLVGLVIKDGVPPAGCELYWLSERAGRVTSSMKSALLGTNIAMALLDRKLAGEEGQELSLTIRNKPVKAVIVPLPFYNRHLHATLQSGSESFH
ncbi:Aminomethyltransferase [compost metagenome]